MGLVVTGGPSGADDLLLEGRPLVAHARAAVAAAGLSATAPGPASPWRDRVAGPLVLHDAACPLLPAAALAEAVALQAAAGPGVVVVGVRPVTDTLKQVRDGVLVGTVDRDALAALASPLVVGPDLLDDLAAALPLTGQLADLSAVLAALPHAPRVPLEVSSWGRRLGDREDVVLMESLHALR